MARMWDVLMYTFGDGDPDGLPGVTGQTYGFVGATSRARRRLQSAPYTVQVKDIYYVISEDGVQAMFDALGDDLSFHVDL